MHFAQEEKHIKLACIPNEHLPVFEAAFSTCFTDKDSREKSSKDKGVVHYIQNKLEIEWDRKIRREKDKRDNKTFARSNYFDDDQDSMSSDLYAAMMDEDIPTNW